MADIGKGSIRVVFDKTQIGKELSEAMAAAGAEGEAAGGLLGGRIGKLLGAGLVVAVGAGLLDIGEKFEDAFHTIEQRTGATGTALAGLEQDFKNVFASAPGATFGNVADAISEVSIRTGLTGSALDDLAKKEVELGKITKSDVGATVESTTALMNKFGVAAKDQSADLDVLFKATQNSGKSLGDLTSDMTRAVPALSGVGMSFSEQAALVSSLEKAGVKVQPVIMGLAKSFKAAADAGKDPISVVTDLVSRIQNAKDPTEQFSIAVQALGARAGGEFVAAVNSGAFSIDELAGKLSDGKDGIDATAFSTLSLGDKFGMLKNKALVALEPIASKILDLVNVVVDDLTPAFAGFGDFLSSTFGPPIAQISADISDFISGFTQGTDALGSSQSQMAQWGAVAYEWFLKVQDVVSGIWAAISPSLESFGSFLSANLQPILIGVGGYIVYLAGSAVIGGLVAALTGLVAAVGAPVIAVASLVAGLVYAYQNFDGFRHVVDQTGRTLLDTFNTVSAVLGPILATLASEVADLARFFIERWDKIRGSVQTVVKAIEIAVAVSLAPALLAWKYFHEQILAVAKFAWDFIKAGWELQMRILGDFFDFVTSLLTGDWGGAWDAFKDIPAAALNSFETMLANTGTFVLDFFSSLPGNIISALGDLGSMLAPTASDLLHGMLNGLVTAWVDVAQFFYFLPGNILALMAEAGTWLFQKGMDLQKGLLDGIVTAAVDLWNWWTGLPGTIAGFFVGAIGWLQANGGDIIRGLIAGVGAFAIHLWVWFISLPGTLLDACKDAANWLVQVGKDLVAGIVKGIASSGNVIADALKSKLPGGGGIPSLGDLGNFVTNPAGVLPSPVHFATGGDPMPGSLFGAAEQGFEILWKKGLYQAPPYASTVIPHDQSAALLQAVAGIGQPASAGGINFNGPVAFGSDRESTMQDLNWLLLTTAGI